MQVCFILVCAFIFLHQLITLSLLALISVVVNGSMSVATFFGHGCTCHGYMLA